MVKKSFGEGDYKDYKGNVHHRKISLFNNSLEIEDSVVTKSVANLHLHVTENAFSTIYLNISSTYTSENAEVSMHYLEKHPAKRLVIPIDSKISLTANF
ncbi:MAG: hypothetical protein IPO48_01960 [Saprospiraceae bacterium]|nr:hypothetical protein [Saprospiraceae bacterium]